MHDGLRVQWFAERLSLLRLLHEKAVGQEREVYNGHNTGHT